VQLIKRGARGKLKEASKHDLGTGEPQGEDLIIINARPSRTDDVGPLWINLTSASE
jgi:hypothetical protein